MIIDPIADMLTRIRNALTSRHKIVNINYSKFTERVVRLFYRIGYIESLKIKGSGTEKYITVFLKYDQNGISVIRGIKRASKPGLRLYCNKNKIPIIYNGIGTAIISTSKGLLTAYRAKQEGIGGEIICFIW
jgi:small subunit ribosomal protein S8